ncbi:hypothetical protein [Thalassospira xiamenensis]|uniref:hypothetical protein n=1 Tax=Thalassospira xiamenensis TaxID=220697 RepID=UPI003AA99C05
MTKQRQPLTEHDAAYEAVLALDESQIKAAINKSVSWLRRAGDPDDDQVNIQYRDAVALDAAMVLAGHDPKFFDAYRNMLESRVVLNAGHEVGNLLERISDSVSGLGRLSDEIRAALDPKGPGGSKVIPHECDLVSRAISETMEGLELMQRDVDALREAASNVHNLNAKEAS